MGWCNRHMLHAKGAALPAKTLSMYLVKYACGQYLQKVLTCHSFHKCHTLAEVIGRQACLSVCVFLSASAHTAPIYLRGCGCGCLRVLSSHILVCHAHHAFNRVLDSTIA